MGAKHSARRKEVRVSEKERAFVARTMDALGLSEAELHVRLTGHALPSIRINTLAARNPQHIAQDVQKLGVHLEKITWANNAYFVDDKLKITASPLFTSGEVYVQTASSLIPAIALAPEAGDTVLDLCAAPGGKSCHIAALTQGGIELWVNDAFKPRIRKLKEVLAINHVRPHQVTEYPAQYADKFLQHDYYDRILLDAQCSGEGRVNLSNAKAGLEYWSLKRVHEYSRLQQRMLRSAYKLLKPGGVLVYSTCTIAPEENELPVDQLVRHTDAVIEPFSIAIAEAKPGLISWQKARLDNSLKGALRIYPSDKMEAFFVCRIRKPVQ